MQCSAAAKMAREFSINACLKAIDVTDLGSKGAYRIGVLSRKKYVRFSPKPSFPDKKGKSGSS